MVISIISWVLIGAFIGWLSSVLWQHPQGCIMDGIVSVVAMLTGVILYGAIAGGPELVELSVFSFISGALLAVLALAVVRAWRTDVEARTVPADEAVGWEPEEAPPAPEEPLSEQAPEDVGQGTLPRDVQEDEPSTPRI